MAISFALGPTTRPRPLSPSTVATLIFSRTILMLGLGLILPSVSMSKYVCSRATPWESMPLKSLLANTSAACLASASAMPKCMKTLLENSFRYSTGKTWDACSSAILPLTAPARSLSRAQVPLQTLDGAAEDHAEQGEKNDRDEKLVRRKG